MQTKSAMPAEAPASLPATELIAVPAVEPSKGSALHGTGIKEIESSSDDDDRGTSPTPEQLEQARKAFEKIQRKLEKRELKRPKGDETIPYEPEASKSQVSPAAERVPSRRGKASASPMRGPSPGPSARPPLAPAVPQEAASRVRPGQHWERKAHHHAIERSDRFCASCEEINPIAL